MSNKKRSFNLIVHLKRVGEGFQEHVKRTRGQHQRRVGLRVGGGDGWGEWGSGGEKMETTVFGQQ